MAKQVYDMIIKLAKSYMAERGMTNETTKDVKSSETTSSGHGTSK